MSLLTAVQLGLMAGSPRAPGITLHNSSAPTHSMSPSSLIVNVNTTEKMFTKQPALYVCYLCLKPTCICIYLHPRNPRLKTY